MPWQETGPVEQRQEFIRAYCCERACELDGQRIRLSLRRCDRRNDRVQPVSGRLQSSIGGFFRQNQNIAPKA